MLFAKGGAALGALLLVSGVAWAGPKEDGLAAFDKFLTLYTAADLGGTVALFAPDALVYGTASTDLEAAPIADSMRKYFAVFNTRKPNEYKATAVGPMSALVLSDNAVLLSGKWQNVHDVDGKPVVAGPYRVSLALAKRGDQWLIVQFHNSPVPPPAPAPAPAAATPAR